MGLQFYRNPEEIDAENAAAAKLDRATAQRRSAIRREPTIRPRREQTSFSNISSIIRNRHEMQQLHSRLHRDNLEADEQIAQLEEELQALRRHRERMRSRIESNRAHIEAESSRIMHRSSDTRDTPMPADPTLAPQQDLLPGAETASQVNLPRPARESNLRFEMAATNSASPTQETNMPSPPRSVTDSGRNHLVDGPLEIWDAVPPLSQDFAPARAARAAIEQADAALNSAADSIRETTRQDQAGLETPPPEAWENSYPPLRRVPHMSPRPLPRTPVDGLGDRRRSLSPYLESSEETTWNTLLSTINANDEAPSTSTSFASMTDLLSTSRSSSYRSSNTQNTSTSFGEIGSSSEETCDLPPGITEDDVRMIRERHRRTARRTPRRRTAEVDAESRRYASSANLTNTGSYGGSESEMSRLLMDHAMHRLRRSNTSDSDALPRIDAFHDILERMQRREHISDEAWALAGLSPEHFRRS